MDIDGSGMNRFMYVQSPASLFSACWFLTEHNLLCAIQFIRLIKLGINELVFLSNISCKFFRHSNHHVFYSTDSGMVWEHIKQLFGGCLDALVLGGRNHSRQRWDSIYQVLVSGGAYAIARNVAVVQFDQIILTQSLFG